MAYSMDLRRRVAATYAKTKSSAATAAQHDVSESWVRRLVQRERQTGSLAPRSSARKTNQRTYDADDEAAIRALIKGRPDATLAEVAGHLAKPVGTTTVWRTLERLGLPRKKSRRTPPSRTAPTSSPSGRRGSGGSPTRGSPT